MLASEIYYNWLDLIKYFRYNVDTNAWGEGPEGCQQTLLHKAIGNFFSFSVA